MTSHPESTRGMLMSDAEYESTFAHRKDGEDCVGDGCMVCNMRALLVEKAREKVVDLIATAWDLEDELDNFYHTECPAELRPWLKNYGVDSVTRLRDTLDGLEKGLREGSEAAANNERLGIRICHIEESDHG